MPDDKKDEKSKKSDTLDIKELQSQYGWVASILNSDPELKRLFKRAVAKGWTPEKFQVELRSTKWYKKNGEAYRNGLVQKKSDPATFKANVEQVRTRLSMMASEFGAVVGEKTLAKMAEQAYMLGWDDNQIRQTLSGYVKYTDGRLLGQAGQWEAELREYARSMGVKISNKTIQRAVQRAIEGSRTIEDAKADLRETAVSAFPMLADRLRSGETVADVMDPYRQTMASILEMDPDTIDLNDSRLRRALSGAGPKGEPALTTLYDFEKQVRKDPRWLSTKNARDTMMSGAQKLLSDWGLV